MGVAVLLGVLTVTFGAGLLLYVIARTGAGSHLVKDAMHGDLPALPGWLWASTFVLFVSSAVAFQALQWARMRLPFQARRAFRLAATLGWVFIALQIPGLVTLVDRYRPAGGERSVVYFLVVFLVGLHLLHAAGGLFPMTALARRASFQREDGPGMERLANVSLYWHFLAGTWLAMFATFSLVR
jgi:cytochrome c oxidase subunit 3